MPFVSAGVRVENDHPPIQVAIRDEDLVGLLIYRDGCGLTQSRRVVAAAGFPLLANLQQELPVVRKLQDLAVVAAGAGEPDITSVIDEKSLFAVGPFIARAGSAPGLDDVPVQIKFQNRGRGNTAVSVRRCVREVQHALI